MTKKDNINNYYKKKYALEKQKLTKPSERAWCNVNRLRGVCTGTYDEFVIQMEKHFDFMGFSWHNYPDWEVDHIVPYANGGEHTVSNLQPLWKLDNKLKGTQCGA